jgi:predicted CDP-diglyceride synthetase/phosphatidate cytidylyltransferase
MSYREKENIVNILSGLVVAFILAWVVYQGHLQGKFDLTVEFNTWGIIFLVFMFVSIVARIIIYIIFHIINAIATRGEEIPVLDERDKIIQLKATRNSHYVFSGGFVLAIVGLSVGLPVYSIFIVFIISGLLSEIVDNGSQIYYYRKDL